MSEFRGKGPFEDIITDEMNENAANQIIVPRICLNHPCEEFSKMDLCKLKIYFSSLPQVAKNMVWNENHPLAVSFVDADDSIVIDL